MKKTERPREFSQKFGRIFKKLRTIKNIGQKTIAERLGVSVSYVSLIESGKRTSVGIDMLEAMCKSIDIPTAVVVAICSCEDGLPEFEISWHKMFSAEARRYMGVFVKEAIEDINNW